jgi:tetratricopeptide (TPR) repeat protein
MKKTILALLASGLVMTVTKAQTIQEGLNHLYADRFQSAIGVFQKLLAVNPNNIDATYWLGQAYFDMDDNAMAKQVYDKALQANGNAPLLLVGMGHYLLLDKKTNEVRQNFEMALTMSKDKKGKDNPDILNAIGRAHTDAKNGDYKYAEQVLQAAVALNQKNPDIFLNLGNAIRKARPGEAGKDAFENYRKALDINPNFDYAYVRLAKLFETQRNWDLVLENLNKAVTVDPSFSLAYYELFYYYFFRQDFGQAENYFNKYVSTRPNEDKMDHDFLNAQLCWVKKDFDCAISKAEMVKSSMGSRVKPRVLRLLSYSYNDKKDFGNAKKNIDDFFVKEKDGFVAGDYKLKAEIYAGSGVPCEELYNIYITGANVDTVLQDKIDYMTAAADDFKKRNCKTQEADMRLAVYQTRTKPNPGVLVNIGILYTQSGDLVRADSVFTAYNNILPDSIYGHYWRGRVNGTLDTTFKVEPYVTNMVNGYSKTLNIAATDKVRFKSMGVTSSLALVGYYNNVKSDKANALISAQKGLELDTSNVQLKSIVEFLTTQKTPVKPPANQKPATPTKNSGTKPAGNKPTSKKPAAAKPATTKAKPKTTATIIADVATV